MPLAVMGCSGVPQIGVEKREELVLFLGRVELEREACEAGVVSSRKAGADQFDETSVGVL